VRTMSVSPHHFVPPLSRIDPCAGIDTLSPPASNKSLEVVAIARGSFNYSCEDAAPANAPIVLEQFTQLYNVSTFLTLFDQEYLQELVQQLYDYDYGEGKNNTLDCIGTIGTLNGSAVVTLYEIDTFDAYVLETIPSPDDPDNNGLWAHSRSKSDFDWEMYRVEMVGGKVPAICAGQPDSFDIEYAAQYWFYHS
jgi:Protein of unknown function (DUF3455)